MFSNEQMSNTGSSSNDPMQPARSSCEDINVESSFNEALPSPASETNNKWTAKASTHSAFVNEWEEEDVYHEDLVEEEDEKERSQQSTRIESREDLEAAEE